MTGLVVVLDSDVIYGVSSTDLLLTLGKSGLFRPLWTNRITSDAIRNLLINRPELDVAQLQRRVDMMNLAFPDACIKVPQDLEREMTNHPGDRHVLATAVHAQAGIVLTRNLRHFPVSALAPFGIEALTPDDLVLRLIPHHAHVVKTAIISVASRLNKPAQTVSELTESLRKNFPRSITHLIEIERDPSSWVS